MRKNRPGERLEEWRNARQPKKMSLRELSVHVDCSLDTIQKIINGETMPSLRTACLIFKLAGIDPQDWCAAAEGVPSSTPSPARSRGVEGTPFRERAENPTR